MKPRESQTTVGPPNTGFNWREQTHLKRFLPSSLNEMLRIFIFNKGNKDLDGVQKQRYRGILCTKLFYSRSLSSEKIIIFSLSPILDIEVLICAKAYLFYEIKYNSIWCRIFIKFKQSKV